MASSKVPDHDWDWDARAYVRILRAGVTHEMLYYCIDGQVPEPLDIAICSKQDGKPWHNAKYGTRQEGGFNTKALSQNCLNHNVYMGLCLALFTACLKDRKDV